MTSTLAGSFSKKAVAATLAGALALTTAGVAPARADTNADAIAAAAFFGLVAAVIIASSRNGTSQPRTVAPRNPLPAECRFHIRHGPDRGTYFGRRCLVANFDQWPRLPDRCERQVELPHRYYDVIAYDAQCLARSGFRADGQARH